MPKWLQILLFLSSIILCSFIILSLWAPEWFTAPDKLMIQWRETAHKSYLAILLSFTLLTLDVILPVPSSLLFSTNAGVWGFFMGGALSFAAIMLSSTLAWYLGYFFKGRRFLFMKIETDPKAHDLLARNAAWCIILTRPLPILAESVAILCGIEQIPFRSYLAYCAIGNLPTVLVFSYIGHLNNQYQHASLIIILLVILLSASFWFIDRRIQRKISS